MNQADLNKLDAAGVTTLTGIKIMLNTHNLISMPELCRLCGTTDRPINQFIRNVPGLVLRVKYEGSKKVNGRLPKYSYIRSNKGTQLLIDAGLAWEGER